MEDLALPPESFDLVYSSLALHYVAELDALMAKVRAALLPGGSLVFSVEHPIFTAPTQPGWSVGEAGRKTWPIDGYLDEGPRSTDWLAKGVVKHHRTIATYLNMLLRLGFAFTHVEEGGPSGEQIAAQPPLPHERQRPPLLVLSARP